MTKGKFLSLVKQGMKKHKPDSDTTRLFGDRTIAVISDNIYSDIIAQIGAKFPISKYSRSSFFEVQEGNEPFIEVGAGYVPLVGRDSFEFVGAGCERFIPRRNRNSNFILGGLEASAFPYVPYYMESSKIKFPGPNKPVPGLKIEISYVPLISEMTDEQEFFLPEGASSTFVDSVVQKMIRKFETPTDQVNDNA
jgi:hypothetical protein